MRPWLRARWQAQEPHERPPTRTLVRMLRIRIDAVGVRPSQALLVTTLLDEAAYPAADDATC